MESPVLRSTTRGLYTWREVHEDIERGHVVGRYGADHAPYHGLVRPNHPGRRYALLTKHGGGFPRHASNSINPRN